MEVADSAVHLKKIPPCSPQLYEGLGADSKCNLGRELRYHRVLASTIIGLVLRGNVRTRCTVQVLPRTQLTPAMRALNISTGPLRSRHWRSRYDRDFNC
jgi:hypothetical protein